MRYQVIKRQELLRVNRASKMNREPYNVSSDQARAVLMDESRQIEQVTDLVNGSSFARNFEHG